MCQARKEFGLDTKCFAVDTWAGDSQAGYYGDEVYEAMDPAFRDRMLDDGEVVFGMEMASSVGYLPTAGQLAQIAVPSVVLAGTDNADPEARLHCLHGAAQWAADGLGVPLIETPGAHLPQATHLHEYAAIVRPVLARLAAPVDA